MGPKDFKLPPEVLEIFREEARENLSAISEALRALEAGTAADPAPLRADVARRLHSVKGAAASLRFEAVARVAHVAETVFLSGAEDRGRLQKVVLAIAWLSRAVQDGAGDLGEILPVLEGTQQAAPGAPPPSAPQAPAHEDTVRVQLKAIDRLLAPLATLAAERGESRFRGERFRQLAETAQVLARRAGAGALADEELQALGELAAQLAREAASARGSARATARAVATLEEQVQGMRLVSLASVEGSLRLAVRETAIRTGKDVSLAVEGGGALLDRRILEELRAPLLHLVRNAVDHGIEPDAERRRAGKPVPAEVRLKVVSLGEVVELTLADDGRGIDAGAIAERAVRLGLRAAEEPSALTAAELWALLATPGFSTRDEVTEISGRGIGMDVVEKTVRALGGAVSMQTEPGRGSTFTLTVPVSVLSTHVLLVRVGEETFALPLSAAEATARLTPGEFFEVGGKRCAFIGGGPAVVHRLGAPRASAPAGRTAAVRVHTAAGPVALLVDEILEEGEVAVRPLGPPVRRVPGVIGTSVAESGRVVVVLNPRELPGLAPAHSREVEEGPKVSARILVVDDSITTRTLERHILERAGFVVGLARDGVEALAALRAQSWDLVVSDLEMPNLDGVGLVRAMRSEARLEALPVILVTSLAAEADRRRAMAAGAQAYIVKSHFDQEALVDAIREHLARRGGHG